MLGVVKALESPSASVVLRVPVVLVVLAEVASRWGWLWLMGALSCLFSASSPVAAVPMAATIMGAALAVV